MSDQQQLRPSDEVDERHLELAREAGEAYLEAVDHMITEVANTGAKTEAGDYVVGFAQEEAEGMYRFDGEGSVDGSGDGGGLTWEEPSDGQNCHLEVVVASQADGRFLPEIAVSATLENEAGDVVGPERIPFVWHPGLYHYGKNLELPGDGTYAITIEVEPATFPRHDETNGDRFGDPVDVRFEDVEIETGRS